MFNYINISVVMMMRLSPFEDTFCVSCQLWFQGIESNRCRMITNFPSIFYPTI
jgi:hypothetical protein